MNKWDNKTTEDLFEVILKLKNKKEAKIFLRDLLTEEEIIEFGKRWQAAQMLDKKVSYTEIVKKTALSSTTVARISKWLKKGTGGYQLMLKKLHYNHQPTKKPFRKRVC